MYIHLFAFLVIASSFFRQLKDWLIVFDIFVAASTVVALVALGQFLELPWLMASSGGERLAGTIGNAGYMAGYLIFGVFWALLLFVYRKNVYLKYYYASIVPLFIFVIINTQTRGGIVALVLSSFVFLMYLIFYYFKQNKLVKNILIGFLVVLLLGIVFLFANKNQAFVSEDPLLSRVTDFSFKSNTVETRLWTWQSAWSGFKERPILGWGQENFYQPFNKYFNPNIYRKATSVAWFDRAHNIIFDRLLTGGIIGLALYLSFLFVPYFYFWKYFLTKEKDSIKDKYLILIIFSLVMMAYFLQNLFIFESLVIYIPLFLTLAFVSLFNPSIKWEVINKPIVKKVLVVLAVVFIMPAIYFFNLKPLQANMDLAKALDSPKFSADQRLDLIKDVLSSSTAGNQEYRLQLFNFFNRLLESGFKDQAVIVDFVNLLEIELNKQVVENPNRTMNNLVLIRFNNFMFNSTKQIKYYNSNVDLFKKISVLSPNRQHIYYESGYGDFYVANYYRDQGQEDVAKEYYKLAIEKFEKALSLNLNNLESYRQLSMILIYSGSNNDRIKELWSDLDKLDEMVYAGLNPVPTLSQLLNTAATAKNYDIVKFFADKLIEIDPNNPEFHIQSALALAGLGRDQEAILEAQKLLEFGEEYKEQVNDFIKRVKNGEFK